MYDFRYHRPATLGEAVELLRNSEDGKYLAGGQTLIPVMKQRLAAPSDLIDLGRIDGLSEISATEAGVSIGGMARHAAVGSSSEIRARIPALAALAANIGDPHVRNCGTIGGSIANNDPAADYPAALLALGAKVITDRRTIGADAFFTDMFETALEADELVIAVEFPVPEHAAYVKFPNPASRYAIAGVMAASYPDGARLAVTGAGPCVFRVAEMESALSANFSASALDGISVPEDDLNSDLHASAAYRSHLITVLAKRAVQAATQ